MRVHGHDILKIMKKSCCFPLGFFRRTKQICQHEQNYLQTGNEEGQGKETCLSYALLQQYPPPSLVGNLSTKSTQSYREMNRVDTGLLNTHASH